MTAVLEREATVVEQESDEEQLFAHYAEKVSVTEGYVLGTPIQAICGKIFIPHRDPDKLPICGKCKDIADALFI